MIDYLPGKPSILATLKHPRDDQKLESPQQGMKAQSSLQILLERELIPRPLANENRQTEAQTSMGALMDTHNFQGQAMTIDSTTLDTLSSADHGASVP